MCKLKLPFISSINSVINWHVMRKRFPPVFRYNPASNAMIG